jgi:type I restriction enzyme, S subunit
MIARISSWKELERWIPGSGASWEAAFPLVPIGDVMRPRRKIVLRGQFGDYLPITIHFDGSIEVRDRRQPFKSSMFAALPGDLVYSKIDVRNGAIGLLPPEIKQAVVTSEYPVLVPDTKQVSVRYLALLLRSPNFQHLLKQAASGTSGRKRVHADNFAELEIPLPELAEQRQLVSDYESALRKAAKLDADASALEERAIREFEAALGLVPRPDLPRRTFQIASYRKLERWSHEAFLQDELLGTSQPKSSFDFVTLEDIANVTYGIQKCPANRPGTHARPYLRVANVRRGSLDLTDIKRINVPDREMKRLRLETGDILFVEGNGTKSELGRAATWNGEIADCVHQNHIIKARPNKTKADSEFLMEWFNTEAGRSHFFRNSKTTTGLGTLNSTDIKTAPVPLPESLDEQRKLVQQLRQARSRVGAKRTEAERLRSQAWTDFVSAIFN